MTTILQFSDPHLMSGADGRLKGVQTAASLCRVVDRARSEIADPARVVLTGDLSHEHTESGYELLKEIMGDWSQRCLLIPGNHDDRRAMRVVWNQVAGEADQDVWFRDELDGWLLIGLDSQVPGEVHGGLSQESLARLSELLAGSPDRPTVIFLHHPPILVESTWIDLYRLQNGQSLATVVGQFPQVRGIFCGHVHQVIESQFASVPCFTAPSTAFQFVPGIDEMRFDLRPPGFRVIELQERELGTRVVRLDAMPFTPISE